MHSELIGYHNRKLFFISYTKVGLEIFDREVNILICNSRKDYKTYILHHYKVKFIYWFSYHLIYFVSFNMQIGVFYFKM